MPISVASIYRYPIKGLSPESLEQVTLTPGLCLPHDRRFALAKAATQFDPAQPAWLAKTNFFMLMRDESLAQLQTHVDEESGVLTVRREGRSLLRARITDVAERVAINAFFAEFLRDAPGSPPRIVEAPGHTFSDAKQKPDSTTYQYVSLVNLASVAELEKAARRVVDPLRFRASLYLSGLPAWEELAWVGSDITVGAARLRVVSPITRCAATSVNPATAVRDLNVPELLRKEFGHITMGIYAEVVAGAEVVIDDKVAPTDSTHRSE